MWFLIKGSVWCGAVLVVLSFFSTNQVANHEGGASAMQMSDAISVATDAYSYISSICAEKPDVCAKGAETISALGVRATEGARVAVELLDSQFGDKAAKSLALQPDPEPTPFPTETAQTTGSTPPAPQPALLTGSIPLPMKRPAQ